MRFTSLIILLGSLLASTAWGASVSQVKNKKLIISLDGESASPGAEFYVLDSSGKKIGLVKIVQVKGSKALGEITKGRASAGMQAQLKGGSSSSTASSASSGDSSSTTTRPRRKGKHTVGFLGGFSMNTMSLTVQDPNTTSLKEDVTMKDNGFNLKAFYDYPLAPGFVLRAATGLEQFTAKGSTSSSICSNRGSKECSVGFNYLAFEGSAHYNVIDTRTKVWLGLGYSFLVAASKENNIPNLSSDNATNQMILIGAGADFPMGSGFIPVAIEYGMFPGSSNVTATSIFLRGGYGFSF